MNEMPPRKCSRCPCAASPSHTLCPHCRRKTPCPKWRPSSGTARGTNGTNAPRATEPVVLVPIARYNPFPGGRPADLPPWTETYLTALAENGKDTLSANAAEVPVRVVRALRAAHPGFAEAVEDATTFYLDRLEASLPGTSKPIGTIARLKADRADRFEPSLIVAKTNSAAADAQPPGIEELARSTREYVLKQLPASTREKLEAEDADFFTIFEAYVLEGTSFSAAHIRKAVVEHKDPDSAVIWARLAPEAQGKLLAAYASGGLEYPRGDVVGELDAASPPAPA